MWLEMVMKKKKRFVANNVFDDVEKTNYSLNNLPILYPPSVRLKGVINARLKSNMEKRKRKPLKDVTRSSKLLFFYLNFILKKKMLVVWFKYLFVVSSPWFPLPFLEQLSTRGFPTSSRHAPKGIDSFLNNFIWRTFNWHIWRMLETE